MKNKSFILSAIWLLSIFSLIFSACSFGSNQIQTNNIQSPPSNKPNLDQPQEGSGAPPENAGPAQEDPLAETPPEVLPPPAYSNVFITSNTPLPPDPIPVEIPTEDGRALEGIFYPGAYNPGPVIVLMHWAGGDMHDWDAIAPWLQNRSLPTQVDGSSPWLDPAWFPQLPEWASFNVLVFNFGGFGASPDGDLALDAKAAVVWASTQETVNPLLITTMGASIGADGSPDGCYLHQVDENTQGECIGAFSLSPGDYLSNWGSYPFTYFDTIEGITSNPEIEKIVYCLAAENDYASAPTCRGPSGISDRYQAFIYSKNQHGMALVDPLLSPSDPPSELNALEIYLLFLQDVYALDFNE